MLKAEEQINVDTERCLGVLSCVGGCRGGVMVSMEYWCLYGGMCFVEEK